jgi:hypothetical protein
MAKLCVICHVTLNKFSVKFKKNRIPEKMVPDNIYVAVYSDQEEVLQRL